jgi:hypothetical protein
MDTQSRPDRPCVQRHRVVPVRFQESPRTSTRSTPGSHGRLVVASCRWNKSQVADSTQESVARTNRRANRRPFAGWALSSARHFVASIDFDSALIVWFRGVQFHRDFRRAVGERPDPRRRPREIPRPARVPAPAPHRDQIANYASRRAQRVAPRICSIRGSSELFVPLGKYRATIGSPVSVTSEAR